MSGPQKRQIVSTWSTFMSPSLASRVLGSTLKKVEEIVEVKNRHLGVVIGDLRTRREADLIAEIEQCVEAWNTEAREHNEYVDFSHALAKKINRNTKADHRDAMWDSLDVAFPGGMYQAYQDCSGHVAEAYSRIAGEARSRI